MPAVAYALLPRLLLLSALLCCEPNPAPHTPAPCPPILRGADEDDSMEDDSGDEEGEGGDGLGVPEQAILTVCEFTGLPRHTAIELLQVHGGDAAAVLAAVFP